jgi:hypothetical protein
MSGRALGRRTGSIDSISETLCTARGAADRSAVAFDVEADVGRDNEPPELRR